MVDHVFDYEFLIHVQLCIRFMKFDEKNWRVSHNSIILLEHLLTHGPESAAEEFQTDKDVIKEMARFNFVDEKGSAAHSPLHFECLRQCC